MGTMIVDQCRKCAFKLNYINKPLSSYMVDRLTPERRSWLMSRVRAKDTQPEIRVRSALHGLGYRFRLHDTDLPGKPDLVFPSHGKVVFVHGCFWHGHMCAKGRRGKSKSNTEFWCQKVTATRRRDNRNNAALRKLGWKVVIVWECQLQRSGWVTRILRFLGPARA